MQIITRFKNWSSIGNKRADLALNHKGFDSGIVSKKITRKISASIAKFLYNQNKNINPNHLTLISTGIGLGQQPFSI